MTPLAMWQLELLWFHWLSSLFLSFSLRPFCLHAIGWLIYQYPWCNQHRTRQMGFPIPSGCRIIICLWTFFFCRVWALYSWRIVAPRYIDTNSAMTWTSPSSSSNQSDACKMTRARKDMKRTVCEISKYNVKINLTYSLICPSLTGLSDLLFLPTRFPHILLHVYRFLFPLYLLCCHLKQKGGVSTNGILHLGVH